MVIKDQYKFVKKHIVWSTFFTVEGMDVGFKNKLFIIFVTFETARFKSSYASGIVANVSKQFVVLGGNY